MGLLSNVRAFKNWPLIYLARRGVLRRPYLLKTWSGQRIEIDPDAEDAGVVKSVFARRSYISDEVSIPHGGVVVDVGANIGAFSLFAARGAGTVLAFEPEPRNHERLRRNIDLNGFRNITPIPMAVSSKTGTCTFHIAADGNSGAHSLHLTYGDSSPENTVTVETLSIADILERHSLPVIDFLKLDCEGAEWEILETLTPEVSARIHRIALETHPMENYTVQDAVRMLEGLGYRTTFGQKENYLFAFRP